MRDESALREPPSSIDAEQSVLGALLLSNAALDRIEDKVSANDFYALAHRVIFTHIRSLITAGKAADVVTLNASMTAAGELEQAGGMAYLGELLAHVPGTSAIEHYAGVVRDRSIRRQMAVLGTTLQEMAFARDGRTAAELLDDMRREVDQISDGGVDEEPVPLATLLPEVVFVIEKREKSDELPGLPTGIVDLDARLLGLRGGDIVVVAGETSAGKTTLAMQFALHAATAKHVPVLVFSMEMKPRALAERAVANVGHVDSHAMRGGRMQPGDWERVSHGINRLNDAAPILIDKSAFLTPERIRARARRAKRKHGIGLVVVDYLQLMQAPGDTRNEQVGYISRMLKLLAMEIDVPILLLSQLNRANAQRTNKRPVRSDLRDSGCIEQDADIILFVFREELHNQNDDELKGKAEIIIAKQREGEVGTVYVAFIGRYNRFADTTWRPSREAKKSAKPRADLDDDN